MRALLFLPILALAAPPVAASEPVGEVVYRHACEDAADLRPFMAARSHDLVSVPGGLSGHALRIVCDFSGSQPLSVLWDLPPLRADAVAVRVRMPAGAGAWTVRVALAAADGSHRILADRPASPDRDGWFAYAARVDDPAARTVEGRGHNPNLVVARPDGAGPIPIYTSLTVRVVPGPGSALAGGEGAVEVDDLQILRDGVGAWE